MKIKMKLIIICLIILLFNIASVCASDVNDTILTDDNGGLVKMSNSDVGLLSEENVSAGNSKTFTDLNNLIRNSNDGDIFLDSNYTYNEETDSDFKNGIYVYGDLNIYGNGFTLDGNNQARIFNLGTNYGFVLKDINFVNGNATGYGGAVNYYLPTRHDCLVINCTFVNNHAAYYGGAADYINAIDCTFVNNTADRGGALYCGSAYNSVFMNNSADHGGAIYETDVDSCLFEYNSANHGGAMAGEIATNCTFNHNSAVLGYSAGAVIMAKVSTDCKFKNNTVNGTEKDVAETVTFFINYNAISALNQKINGNNLTEIYLSENYTYNRGADVEFKRNTLNINRDITIYGNGITVDGFDVYKDIFNVTGGKVTFKDLIFKNTIIWDYSSSLNIVNCTFIKSKLRTNSNGVVLNCSFINESIMSYGTVKNSKFTKDSSVEHTQAVNCIFYNNYYYNAGGAMASGSAVNCTFINNSAKYGGAVASCSVENCTFINNSADEEGGAMYLSTALNCVFINNSADTGGAMYRGSAVNCTFIGNSADNGGAIAYGTLSYSKFINNSAVELGGAVYNSNAVNSMFENNYAASGGAMNGDNAINCTFRNNVASDYGGAVCNAKVSSDSEFINNMAATGSDTYNVSFFKKTIGKSFTELNNTINGNNYTEIYLDGNYVFDYQNDADFVEGILIDRPVTIYGNSFTLDALLGARIFKVTGSSVTFRDINFIRGKASQSGGAIYGTSKAINCNFSENSAGNAGGAICRVDAENCSFTNNSVGAYGGAMSAGDAVNCIFINNTCNLFYGGAMNSGVAENCIFINNHADLGGATSFTSAVNCIFIGNSAVTTGGALCSNPSNTRYAIDCIFVNNTCEGTGGAMSYAHANGCTFINNNAGKDGGALWQGNAFYSDFINNTAAGDGGAIWGGEHFASDCNFINNSAANGGAVYKVNTAYSNFTNNHATGNGGAAYQSVVMDSKFEYNSAKNGGAISGMCAVSCEFNFNNATNGGIVYSARVSTDSKFNSNYANDTSYVTFFNRTVGKTFYDLDCLINDNKDSDIYLNDDYSFDISSDFNYKYGIIIDRNITLHGNGHTIDANQIARIFKVTNMNVTFVNVTFINGHAYRIYEGESGGAIFGMSYVINCTFINNYAQGSGGAVNLVDYLINSTFINNTANSGGASYRGNAYNCTFIGNRANRYGGAISGAYEEAVNCYFGYNSANFGSATDDIDVYNCTFIDKTSYTKEDYVYDGEDENCTFIFLPKFYLDTQNFTTTYNSNVSFPISLKTIFDIEVDDANTTISIYNGENMLVGTYYCLSGEGWKVNLDVGTYTAHVSVEERYGDAKPVNVTLTINKAQPEVTIDVSDIYIGETLTVNVQLPSAATGNATVNLSGKTKVVNLNEGIGSVDFNNLTLGTYLIAVSYDGDINYLNASTNATVNINRSLVEIVLAADSVVYGDDLTVNVQLPGDAEGPVNVTVGDMSKLVSLEKGIGYAKFNGLAAGTYAIKASYGGDSKYLNSSSSLTVNVNRSPLEIMVAASPIVYGEDLVVSVQLPSDVSRRVTVSVNGENKIVSLKEGIGSVKFSGLGAGNYVVEASYVGDSNYLNSSASTSVNVNKAVADITLFADSVVYGDDLTVDVQLPGDAEGPVNVTVGDMSKLVSLEKGAGYAKFSGLTVGAYTVSASYDGDSNYIKSLANLNVNVNRGPANIIITADSIVASEDLVVNVQLPDDASRRVSVEVNNVSKMISLKNGIGSAKFSGLAAGTYSISASYGGDSNYLKSSATASVKVNRGPANIIIATDSIVAGEDLVVNVQLPDDATRRVTVSVNGENKVVSLKNGVGTARFSGLTMGTYTITASYGGDSNYLKSSATASVKVNRGPAAIDVVANPVSYGEPAIVEIQLPSDVTRRAVVVIDNNITKTVSLKNGSASVAFNNLAVGTHDITVSYNGDSKYLKSSVNTTVKVTKATPQIQVTANNISAGEKLTVSVKLPADVVKRAVVTIDGKKHYVTLKNGSGSIKISGLSVGTHDVEVSYAGDANYKKASFTTSVEVTN